MALNARKAKAPAGKKYPPLDPGTYPARLVQVLDLGLQAQLPYQGQEKPPANEIMLTYEFLDEFLKNDDGEEDTNKPRWYSETMPLHNLDVDKAKSTKRYFALDPKEEFEGDFTALLGKPCMVTLQHKENKKDVNNPYVNVSSVSAMRPKEAAKAPELVNPPKVFDLENPDMEIYLSLPQWLQEKIKKNLEFGGSPLEELLESHGGGDKKQGNDGGQEDEAPNSDEEGEDW
jgi:hypothetical protein